MYTLQSEKMVKICTPRIYGAVPFQKVQIWTEKVHIWYLKCAYWYQMYTYLYLISTFLKGTGPVKAGVYILTFFQQCTGLDAVIKQQLLCDVTSFFF